MDLITRYNTLIGKLSNKSKRYVHHNSVKNFTLHVNELPKQDHEKSMYILEKYFYAIECESSEITGETGISLFSDYVFPLGEIYRQLGFKKIIPLKNAIFFAVHVDIILWLSFFKFPYPILTGIAYCYEYLQGSWFKKATKAFGVFY